MFRHKDLVRICINVILVLISLSKVVVSLRFVTKFDLVRVGLKVQFG